MQKLIAGIISAFMMTAGLVAFSGTQANAAPGDAYPGSTPTVVESKPLKPFRSGKPRIRMNIEAVEGAADPRGHVFITFVRRDGKVTYSFKRFYVGDPRNFVLPKPKPGRYVVTVTFVPKPRSIYQPSTDVFNMRVFRKARR